jgi:hypothetical protein
LKTDALLLDYKLLSTYYVWPKSSSYPTTRHGGAWGGRRYSSYSFLTSASDGGEWSASRSGRALPPVPIAQEAEWASQPAWTHDSGKILCPCRGSNPDRPAVQSVVDTILTELLGSYYVWRCTHSTKRTSDAFPEQFISCYS